MWHVINSSALIGWNILSSLNAVISINEKNWILTGHVILKLPYNFLNSTVPWGRKNSTIWGPPVPTKKYWHPWIFRPSYGPFSSTYKSCPF